MTTSTLHRLTARQAADRLERRELRAVDLMQACLERIAERESTVHAFIHLAPEAALAQARALDAGPRRGPLHGLPLGVKDLIDTADAPTAYGSTVYAGHQPAADAAVVTLCRAAGAVMAGKTVSTEFAYFMPGATCNPHAAGHTPGGSSSGSAAAVADAMLPLALGTQTAGSIIRPAAYCGVVGYKPSHGRVPRGGVKGLSDTLDTIGGFGRCVDDAALLGAVLTGDPRLMQSHDGSAPRIGLCRTPEWGQADADVQRAWARAASAFGEAAAEVAWPTGLPDLVAVQKTVMAYEMGRQLGFERLHFRDRLSARLLALLDEGQAIDGIAHAAALATAEDARRRVDRLFETHDVLLAPSAMSEAPAGLDATGDPLFCRAWTLLGLPCLHLPVGTGVHGLPVGLQLVGRRGEDHRLMAAARWCEARLAHGG